MQTDKRRMAEVAELVRVLAFAGAKPATAGLGSGTLIYSPHPVFPGADFQAHFRDGRLIDTEPFVTPRPQFTLPLSRR